MVSMHITVFHVVTPCIVVHNTQFSEERVERYYSGTIRCSETSIATYQTTRRHIWCAIVSVIIRKGKHRGRTARTWYNQNVTDRQQREDSRSECNRSMKNTMTKQYISCIFSFGYFPASMYNMPTVYFQPLKMEPTHGSETSAYYTMTPGEIPKRKYTIFKSRRKLEIYNTFLFRQRKSIIIQTKK